MKRIAFALLTAFVLNTTAANSQTFGANDAPFLNLMGSLEGPGGFADVYDAAPFLPPEPLDTMTVGEVLAYQNDIRAAGTASSAVARYQFIYNTLNEMVATLSIHPDLVFDAEVQTYLARHLMKACGFYNPDADINALGNCLAGVWAALPLFDGPYAGRSAHEGIAGNRALVDVGTVKAVLEARFLW